MKDLEKMLDELFVNRPNPYCTQLHPLLQIFNAFGIYDEVEQRAIIKDLYYKLQNFTSWGEWHNE